VGVLALAVLAGMALSHGLHWIAVYTGIDDMPLAGVRQLVISNVIAYGLALIAAVIVIKHPTVSQLSLEVVDELAKVTWPSGEETGRATKVVIVTVVICAAYLGAFDAVWLAITDLVLGIEPDAATNS